MAAVPQGTQSGWDRSMGTLKVVLKGQSLAAGPQHSVTSLQLLLHCATSSRDTGLAQGWHRQEGTKGGPEQGSDNPRGTAASKSRNWVSNPPGRDPKIPWAALNILALSDGKMKKLKGDKSPAFTFSMDIVHPG